MEKNKSERERMYKSGIKSKDTEVNKKSSLVLRDSWNQNYGENLCSNLQKFDAHNFLLAVCLSRLSSKNEEFYSVFVCA